MSWQPIETAPKDGTPVLLYGYTYEGGLGVYAAFWNGCVFQLCAYSAFDVDASHWAQMPGAPEGSKGIAYTSAGLDRTPWGKRK